MIAKLKGLLDETGTDWAVIDVQGVGYLVHCSAKSLSALGERGEACTLYTDLQVSENDMRLLGFAEAAERDWFRLLTQVQGVGSKVALAILSALSVGELQAACAGGDAAMVARGLVDADLDGLSSHGVMLVDMYIERLQKGSDRSPWISSKWIECCPAGPAGSCTWATLSRVLASSPTCQVGTGSRAARSCRLGCGTASC